MVSSLWGWAYARSYDPTSGTDDTFDVISDGPVDSGEFTLKLPDGDYKIGLWIGPESGYTMAADPNGSTSEVEPSVSLSGSEASSSVTIYVGTNDKTITGAFLVLALKILLAPNPLDQRDCTMATAPAFSNASLIVLVE